MDIQKLNLQQLIVIIPVLTIILYFYNKLVIQQIKTLKNEISLLRKTQYSDALREIESHEKIIFHKITIIKDEIQILKAKLLNDPFVSDCDAFLRELTIIIDNNDATGLIDLISEQFTFVKYSIDSIFKKIDEKLKNLEQKYND